MFKGRRQPLSAFRGVETIFLSHVSVVRTPDHVKHAMALGPDDITLDRTSDFGIEILLAESLVELPVLPDRPNRELYVKDSVTPLVLVEVFDMLDRNMRRERYPVPANYDWFTPLIPQARRRYLMDLEASAVPLVERCGVVGEVSFRIAILQIAPLRISLRFDTRQGTRVTRLGPPEGILFALEPDTVVETTFLIGIQMSAAGTAFGTVSLVRHGDGPWRGGKAFGGDRPEVLVLYQFNVPPGTTSLEGVNIQEVDSLPLH